MPQVSRLFLCCFLFFAEQSAAQSEHINFRHFSLPNGLNSYKVVKVLQDHYGFIWFATQDGLNRLDGKSMSIYNKSASAKHLLTGTDITDILEDTIRNILWAISSYGGLNGIDLTTGDVKYSLPESDSLNRFSNAWLKCMVLSGAELWIGSFDGISIINPDMVGVKKNIPVPFQKNNKDNDGYDINLLYRDEYNRIWAFIANYGLVIYSGSDHSVIAYFDMNALHLKDGNTSRQFYDGQHTGRDQMLLATNQGIKSIQYTKNASLQISDMKIPAVPYKDVISFKLDSSKNLWLATNRGLFRLNSTDGHIINIKDDNRADQQKWLTSVYSIFFDNQNNLWLGSLQGLAVATNPHPVFLNFFQSADFKATINRAYYVFPYNDSVEYVCAEDGFYRVDNTSDKISQLKSGISFSFMFQHKDGNLIVSSENGLFIFHPPDHFTEIESKYPEFSVIKSQNINSAVCWGDSLAILGSESGKGVYSWNYKQHIIHTVNSKSPFPLKSDIVNGLYKDKTDRIWILSDNSFALYYPADKNVINYELTNPATRQPLNLFFDVCETRDAYWLASYGSGIIELHKNLRLKRIISSNQGMANTGLYKLFPVDDSLIYATSNNGLCRINILHNTISNYFERDGLHSNAFEEACGIEKDGKIYAGGPNGFSIINTDYLGPNDHSPHLYFSNIIVETSLGSSDTSNLFMESVVLPSNTLRASIYFCGINYSNPEKTIFAYKIKEQNNSWINLGTENSLVVTGYPPGTYTLQVKSANEDSLWSEPIELRIDFLPKWYQSGWFRLLALITLGGILFSLYRYRIGELKKTLVIRTKISQDLHDEVGSTLSGIGMMGEVAKQQLKSKNLNEVQIALDKIITNADEVLTTMSDIVWAINPKNDTFEKMITRLKSYALNATSSHDIRLHFEAEPDLQQYNLSMQQRKNIYLICKESINNSARYAQCRNLYFTLRRDGNQFQISIQDDGKGFNMQKVSEGNGLYNMQARAREIKAVLKIDSEEGNGTVVSISLRIT